MPPINHYAVMGNPVKHSLSPRIYPLFAAQTHQAITYSAIEVPLDGFAAAVSGFVAQGGCGLNIMLPFKQQAFALAHTLTARALAAKAVNVLRFAEDGCCYGDNTDGIGLVRDIENRLHCPLVGKRILLLGAGGAVRGILAAFLERAPVTIHIANRTAATARALAEEFQGSVPVIGGHFSELAGLQFDIIIDGTSAALHGEWFSLPADLHAENSLCYDLSYHINDNPFFHWAHQHGAAQCVGGLGMLVEQAAEAFYFWRGVRPATLPVYNALCQ